MGILQLFNKHGLNLAQLLDLPYPIIRGMMEKSLSI
jgi:hypothetical protein